MAKLKAFTMPKWGIEMAEGTIAEWMVAENAPFARGTVLTLIETDKITNEVEAEADGRFVRILAKAGDSCCSRDAELPFPPRASPHPARSGHAAQLLRFLCRRGYNGRP